MARRYAHCRSSAAGLSVRLTATATAMTALARRRSHVTLPPLSGDGRLARLLGRPPRASSRSGGSSLSQTSAAVRRHCGSLQQIAHQRRCAAAPLAQTPRIRRRNRSESARHKGPQIPYPAALSPARSEDEQRPRASHSFGAHVLSNSPTFPAIRHAAKRAAHRGRRSAPLRYYASTITKNSEVLMVGSLGGRTVELAPRAPRASPGLSARR